MQYRVVSSENISRFASSREEMVSGRSLVYGLNKIAPKTDPCGTPQVTLVLWDLPSPTVANCVRSDRLSVSHCHKCPMFPYPCNVCGKMACETESKAFQKSMNTANTTWRLSRAERHCSVLYTSCNSVEWPSLYAH